MIFPAISELVPQKPPMLLLDHVVTFGDDRVTCSATPSEDSIFFTDGQIPAVLTLEYMAQAVATYVGLTRHGEGGKPKIGYIISARNFEVCTDHLALGQELTIQAQMSWSDDVTAKFDCQVSQGERQLASTQLTVFEPPEET
jgi:predicted hotdog family 3-hydroxylacyl-ACP dehydratase